MKKNDVIKKVEWELVTDPLTKVQTMKKFEHTRKCVSILKGKVNTQTKVMEYVDVSGKDLDMVELDNPDVPHERYVITYDNIDKKEIP